jgi:hypothetical protein
LHSVAGGTNLSKGEKIGIGVGVAAAVTGLYLVPRIYKTNKLRNLMIKEAQSDDGFARAAEEGIDNGYGKVRLTTDFMGFQHVGFSANSLTSRLKVEWNASLFGHIHKFDPPTPPEPDPEPIRDSVAISDADSEIQSAGAQEVRSSIRAAVGDDVPVRAVDNNVRRSFIEPEREADDLARDFRDAANAGVRPKSIEVVVNGELDSMAIAGLERGAQREMASLDFDGLSQSIKNEEGNLLSSEKAALRQDFDGFESSVENNLSDDLETVENYIMDSVDKEVSRNEIAVEDVVQTEEAKAEQAFASDAEAAKAAFETKVENAIEGADSRI